MNLHRRNCLVPIRELQGGEGRRHHASGARTLRPCRIVQAFVEQPQRTLPAAQWTEPDAVSRQSGKKTAGIVSAPARVVETFWILSHARRGVPSANRVKRGPMPQAARRAAPEDPRKGRGQFLGEAAVWQLIVPTPDNAGGCIRNFPPPFTRRGRWQSRRFTRPTPPGANVMNSGISENITHHRIMMG